MLSTDSEFKKLLLLHSRDRREKKMLDELKNVPLEISRTEEKILIEKKSIEMAMEGRTCRGLLIRLRCSSALIQQPYAKEKT